MRAAVILAVPLLLGAAGHERPVHFQVGVLEARGELQQQRRRTQTRRPPARRAPPPPPLNPTAPRSADQLRADLGSLLTRRVRSGQWGVMVSSVTRGDTLFAASAGELLLPASTMKLITAAIALDRFGTDFRFSTDVLSDGSVDGSGTLNGNLFIRGDGDPTFSRRYHPGDYSAPVNKLAELVASAGIRRVTGSIIGDATAFDAESYPAGWLTRYQGAGYAARVSSLSLNENVVWVTVAPGNAGQAARVWLEPATTTIPLRGSVRTVAGTGASVRAINARDGAVQVSGSIGARSPVRRFGLVVLDPPSFTAGAFHASLLKQGITVDGDVRLGATPPGATKVASLLSPPLDQIVAPMNRESINLFAELLFKNAARGPQRERQGSAASAEAAIREFYMRKLGGDASTLVAADGSGLSTLDRITSRQMIQLLHYAHSADWGATFHASLPVAGVSELLRNRMRRAPAGGNLHAKTGTTDDVIGLAGYVTAENGEVLAFSFLYNGSDRWNARATIDVMGETLAGFARP
ncbi:D-alanyl-D-alanine carboxypeptidase/D-alanyl-D-alanine-endopeptidase [soil metagenome]